MAARFDEIENAVWILEKVSQVGRLTGPQLAEAPGWDRVKAWRYLTKLSEIGLLEKVGGAARPEYVLGRRLVSLLPDLRL